ncbi:uncharacterized protein LOC117105360 [Anneissia japonica]|uniref:uncharacterized protein LOC117105360 n=1 Tax=Anneissia japonica TaxID=1529436 RepID=UPI0014258C81|nr:uncharacterized protein LOC117105360 [Anneissia japonica]
MRTLIFLFCLILTANGNIISLDFTQCSECDCKPPQNSSNPALMVHDSENDCYCMCGNTRSHACDSTGDCHSGLFCTAPDSETGQGVCDDACNSPHMSCETYERCELVNDIPTCICKVFDCSSSLTRPICAEGNVEFPNRCFYENTNCDRKRVSLTPLPILGHGTCMDVVNLLNSEPENSGNAYNPLL